MALAGEHYVVDVVMGRQAQECRCRLYYIKTAGPDPTQAQLDTYANTIFTTLAVSLLACLSDSAQFRQIQMFLRGGAAEMEAYSTAAAADGAVSGDMFPEECAVVIQRRTGLPGRDKRGRIFIPFIGEADADDSTLTAPAVTRFKALATALKTPLVSGGITLSPRTPSFQSGILNPVIQCRVLSEICSRRQRRSPKRALPLAP